MINGFAGFNINMNSIAKVEFNLLLCIQNVVCKTGKSKLSWKESKISGNYNSCTNK